MTNIKEVIEALRWGANEWDKTAINPYYGHDCKLCEIFNDSCVGCPLHIRTMGNERQNECANWGRYIDARFIGDLKTVKKEAAILAGVMRWEAHKLENER